VPEGCAHPQKGADSVRVHLVRGAINVLLAFGPTASGQTPSKPTPADLRAAYEAHQRDFDYLLGDWEFTGNSAAYGRFRGLWSATRLSLGQILDEYRVVDDAGNTVRLTTTIRAYNAALDRWDLVGMDAGGGLMNTGSGKRVDAEVHIDQRFGVVAGNPFILRIRYYDIGEDHVSWSAEQSTDDGKTWSKDFQKLDAHRIGDSPSMEPLTSPKRLARVKRGRT
jgi:hypothetical protein